MLRPDQSRAFTSLRAVVLKKEALQHYNVHEHPPNDICYVAIEMGIAGSALTVWQEAGEELIQRSVFSRYSWLAAFKMTSNIRPENGVVEFRSLLAETE